MMHLIFKLLIKSICLPIKVSIYSVLSFMYQMVGYVFMYGLTSEKITQISVHVYENDVHHYKM